MIRSRAYRTSRALLVYLYMCSGSVIGFFAIVCIGEHRARMAFLLLFITNMIDYSDGTIGRKLDAYSALPMLDNWKLDGVIDFVNLSLAPTYLLWTYDLLPAPKILFASLTILSSLYRFSLRADPLFEKGFYVGLPVLWLFPTFYQFFFRMPANIFALVIVIMTLASFLQFKFLHIARFGRHIIANSAPLLVWWAIFLAITQALIVGHLAKIFLVVSLLYPIFYIASSLYLYKKYEA